MTATNSFTGLEMAKSIETIVTEGAADAEKQRTLPQKTVDALWESGLMQWMNPVEAKGTDPSLLDMIDVWQELARQDGSVGWVSIANLPSTAAAAAYLPEQGFDEVFVQNDYRVTMGGHLAPNGQGNTVEGGYQLSGFWSFGSGTAHSQYIGAGFIGFNNGDMIADEAGMPTLMAAIIPRDEINFTDGWHVTCLKGTGSFDYNVQDLFVPEYRTYQLFTRTPVRGSNTYKLGMMPIVAAGHAAWALGVARSALDDISQLASSKTRMGEQFSTADKLTFQRDLAHHESMWRAARLLVTDTFSRISTDVKGGEILSPLMRADMRMAATYATEASREVVQFAHLFAGTNAIREGSRLERAFRDMYTGTQHAFISEKTYTDSAKIMLGLAEDFPGL